jgi:L-cysteine desulfidase
MLAPRAICAATCAALCAVPAWWFFVSGLHDMVLHERKELFVFEFKVRV